MYNSGLSCFFDLRVISGLADFPPYVGIVKTHMTPIFQWDCKELKESTNLWLKISYIHSTFKQLMRYLECV